MEGWHEAPVSLGEVPQAPADTQPLSPPQGGLGFHTGFRKLQVSEGNAEALPKLDMSFLFKAYFYYLKRGNKGGMHM